MEIDPRKVQEMMVAWGKKLAGTGAIPAMLIGFRQPGEVPPFVSICLEGLTNDEIRMILAWLAEAHYVRDDILN